jgi:hypothetical protein
VAFEEWDLIVGDPIAIPAGALAHNDEALKWAEQWSKFWVRFGGSGRFGDEAIQITSKYTFEQLDTRATLEDDLVEWLDLHELKPFTIYFQENWFTSLSMLKHIDEDMLQKWGIQETPVWMIMKEIRELP